MGKSFWTELTTHKWLKVAGGGILKSCHALYVQEIHTETHKYQKTSSRLNIFFADIELQTSVAFCRLAFYRYLLICSSTLIHSLLGHICYSYTCVYFLSNTGCSHTDCDSRRPKDSALFYGPQCTVTVVTAVSCAVSSCCCDGETESVLAALNEPCMGRCTCDVRNSIVAVNACNVT